MNAFIILQLREAPSLSAKLHQAVIRVGFALTGICAFCTARGCRVDLQTSGTEIARLCSLGIFTHLALVYGCNAPTNQKKGDYAFEEKKPPPMLVHPRSFCAVQLATSASWKRPYYNIGQNGILTGWAQEMSKNSARCPSHFSVKNLNATKVMQPSTSTTAACAGIMIPHYVTNTFAGVCMGAIFGF